MEKEHIHQWDILHLTNNLKEAGGCFSHKHTEICIICKKTKEEIENEKK